MACMTRPPYLLDSTNATITLYWIAILVWFQLHEYPILWPPDVKNWLIGKDPDAGKDQRQEEKGTTEDEMVWWHDRLDGYDEFERASGVGDGQGSLVCAAVHEVTKSQTWLSDWTELSSLGTSNSALSSIRNDFPQTSLWLAISIFPKAFPGYSVYCSSLSLSQPVSDLPHSI